MPNNWFRFKQFTIQQEHAAMKVGTDGVLLGAWASVQGSGSRVLDVGTGTGLIALMIAQRTRDVNIDTLEIDASSAMQAKENFQDSPWKDRLNSIHTSFQEYSSLSKTRYDQIICNPPFFTGSKKTESKSKNLARHDDSLSLKDLFKCSVSLMKETAIISLILPVDKEVQAMDRIHEQQLYCRRLTRVKPTPQKPVNRILLEVSLQAGKCEEDELCIEMEKRHMYSNQFKSLTEKFYLGEGDW
jgi:tRNA1Val (adenine37-N6)-methyltransferase